MLAKTELNLIRELQKINKRLSEGQLDGLEDRILRFAKKFGKSDLVWNALGEVRYKSENFLGAITALKTCLALNPSNVGAIVTLSSCFEKLNDNNTAIKYAKKAIEIDDQNSAALHNLGVLFSQSGEFVSSKQCHLRALEIDPMVGRFHRAYANLHTYTSIEDRHFKSMLQYLHDEEPKLVNDPEIYVAISKAYKDCGFHKASFAYLKLGNDLAKTKLSYDPKNEPKVFRAIGQFYVRTKNLTVKISQMETTPIFIVGMPRSGTTLLEARLARHKKIVPLGELGFIEDNVSSYISKEKQIDQQTLNDLRDGYLSHISELSDRAPFIIDKMPANFRFIGLINKLFPEAKVLHISRDPRATCWSIYSKYFVAPGMSYSFDLAAVVQYYNLYTSLMSFWRKSLPSSAFMDVGYEKLTESLSKTEKEIFGYLGLEKPNDKLPNNYKGIVKTASLQQVRQPIYQNSSKEWERYEPFVREAFDLLAVKRVHLSPDKPF